MVLETTLRQLAVKLHEIGAVKFGSFTLKTGIVSPVYFDLRVVVSYPDIMELLASLMGKKLEGCKGEFDVLCGVPYTALPIATLISVQHNVPMILKRKEQKNYGTGKLIEGKYEKGSRCVIIEDVITSGSSIRETTEALRNHHLSISKALVILDRCQGAEHNLLASNIQVDTLITLHDMLEVLLEEKLITAEVKLQTEEYLTANQTVNPQLLQGIEKTWISTKSNPVTTRLLNIMKTKKSNLCLSADLNNWETVLEAVELIGEKICVLKTHADTLQLKGDGDFEEFIKRLKELAENHNFLIMEDRKFADIGSTVQKQLQSKPFKISEWADLITVHGTPGPGILQAISQLDLMPKCAVVMIAEMSSEGNLTTLPEYQKKIFQMSQDHENLITGYVGQSRAGDPKRRLIQFTPGVSLVANVQGDGLGQQYSSVEEAVGTKGADVIIVGRGILKHVQGEWKSVAEKYRTTGWKCFLEKISHDERQKL